MMVEEHWESVIGGELLIVRKYDLKTILKVRSITCRRYTRRR